MRIPVDSIMVTVNSLRPETLGRIKARVALPGRVFAGLEAARTLMAAHREGIVAAARAMRPSSRSTRFSSPASTTAR